MDFVSNFVRQNSNQVGQNRQNEKTGWQNFFGKTRTTDLGLITAVGLLTLGFGGLAGIITIRTSR